MEGSVDGPLSLLAGCHQLDTQHSLLRECPCLTCIEGWPSQSPPKRMQHRAMLSWLLSHFPRVVTSVSPRGRSSTSCICMAPAGAWPHLSILQCFQQKMVVKQGKVTRGEQARDGSSRCQVNEWGAWWLPRRKAGRVNAELGIFSFKLTICWLVQGSLAHTFRALSFPGQFLPHSPNSSWQKYGWRDRGCVFGKKMGHPEVHSQSQGSHRNKESQPLAQDLSCFEGLHFLG